MSQVTPTNSIRSTYELKLKNKMSQTSGPIGMVPTKDIGSTPELIFGSQDQYYMLDAIRVKNQVNRDILVSVYILREESNPTPEAVEYPFESSDYIKPQQSLDLLKGSIHYIEPGDLVFAYSDAWDNFFTTFISFRQVTDLT